MFNPDDAATLHDAFAARRADTADALAQLAEAGDTDLADLSDADVARLDALRDTPEGCLPEREGFAHHRILTPPTHAAAPEELVPLLRYMRTPLEEAATRGPRAQLPSQRSARAMLRGAWKPNCLFYVEGRCASALFWAPGRSPIGIERLGETSTWRTTRSCRRASSLPVRRWRRALRRTRAACTTIWLPSLVTRRTASGAHMLRAGQARYPLSLYLVTRTT
jgi:hypothetical protein